MEPITREEKYLDAILAKGGGGGGGDSNIMLIAITAIFNGLGFDYTYSHTAEEVSEAYTDGKTLKATLILDVLSSEYCFECTTLSAGSDFIQFFPIYAHTDLVDNMMHSTDGTRQMLPYAFIASTPDQGDPVWAVSTEALDGASTINTLGQVPFIIDLTPTAQDYSGTMSTTSQGINNAIKSNRTLILRFHLDGDTYLDTQAQVLISTGNSPVLYGSFVYTTMNMLISIETDQSNQTYHTTLYPLTPYT